MEPTYHIFSLGDAAITLDLGNSISRELNQRVRSMQQWLQKALGNSVRDVVTGYSSVTVLYDPVLIRKNFSVNNTSQEWMEAKLREAWNLAEDMPAAAETDNIRIPVCYDDEFGQDLETIARARKISKQEIIRLHHERVYYIYLIGFLPGFSYMAEVDDRLIMPRKLHPVSVAAGSVGISGKQTGIYPLQCPGGWQIIGRTPLKLFDHHAEEPVRLKAGTEVQFYPISRDEFDYEWFRENGSAE